MTFTRKWCVFSSNFVKVNYDTNSTFQQLLQQHINRGLKRHARFTGREAPSARELRDNLHKRLYIPGDGPGSRNSKRYNRQGLAAGGSSFLANSFAQKGHGKKGKNRNKG